MRKTIRYSVPAGLLFLSVAYAGPMAQASATDMPASVVVLDTAIASPSVEAWIRNPTSFASSSRRTEDSSAVQLPVYLGEPATLGIVREVAPARAPQARVPTDTASIVQMIPTSDWDPASPDPSGVVYLGSDSLMVADSEVNETTGAGYNGVNLWQFSIATGEVEDTGTTHPAFSSEPTGLGYDPATDTLFISDDDAGRVFLDRPGSDGRFGTSDDDVSDIDTGDLGASDTEDPEFDPTSGYLYFLDGASSEIYEIDPINGTFGDGDDEATHFDIGYLGPSDWEGLALDPDRNNLLAGARSGDIYEITKAGVLVRIIDVDGISGLDHISGLAMAPASDVPGRMNYWIVDRGTDNNSNSNENDGKLFEITVEPPPPTPPVAMDQSVTTAFNTPVPITLEASDVNGDPLTYSIVDDPSHGLLSPVNEDEVMYTPTTGYSGSDIFTFKANDGTSDSNPATVSITVNPQGNQPPVLDPINDKDVDELSPLAFTAFASDPDPSDTLTFTLQGTRPPGAAISSSGGDFTWTPTEAQGPGNYDITIRITDDGSPNRSDEKTFTVRVTEVNQPPDITSPGSQADGEGDSPSIVVEADDPDQPANTLDWVAVGLPPGLNIDSASGEISGTVDQGATAGSPYSVTVTVDDNGNPKFQVDVNFTWTIVDTNRSPTLNPIGPKEIDEGSLLAFTATASDPDASDTLTFTLEGTPPPGASITPGGGFTWTPTEAQGPGAYNITIRVTDDGVPNLWDEETITVTVAEVASPLPPPPPTPSPPAVLPATLTPVPHDVGLVDPVSGMWHLRKATTGAITSFTYGVPGDIPFMGDWNCNGVETPGLYRQSDGFAYIRNSNTFGIADVTFFMGNPSDIPLAGDFNGDGCDTVSIYRPSEQRIYIANTLGPNNGAISADFSYIFGNPGDKPFVGDFNGNGSETIGLHRESTGFVYFRNTHTIGNADVTYFFGDPGDRLIAGDWGVVDGVFTPGVYRPSEAIFFFRHTNTQGNADSQFVFGQSPFLPVSGAFGLG